MTARLTQDFYGFGSFSAIVIASLILQWYAHACGLNYSVDSLDYLAAAKSFQDQGSLLDRGGTPFSHWPPLFPVILSFFDDSVSALKWIHLIIRIACSFYLLWLSKRLIKNGALRILFLLVTILGVHLMMVSVFVWTEMIFILLALTTLYCACNLERSNYYSVLLLASGLLLCLQRHAGLFWMTSISIWIFWDSTKPLNARLVRSLGCFIICTSGFWIWNLYHTQAISSEFNLFQHDYFSYVFFNLNLILQTLGKLFLPFSGWIATVTGVSVITVIGISVKKFLKTDRDIQLLATLILGYLIGFLILSRLDVYEMDRYLSPIVPLVYLIACVSLEKIMTFRSWANSLVVLIIIGSWSAYPLTRTVKNSFMWHERGCIKPELNTK